MQLNAVPVEGSSSLSALAALATSYVNSQSAASCDVRLRPSSTVKTQEPDDLTAEVAYEQDENENLRILSLLLGDATQNAKVRARAEFLWDRYGSFESIMLAAHNEFVDMEALTDRERMLFKAVKGVSANIFREDACRNPLVSDWDALLKYLRMSLAHERLECARLLFFDTKHRLIKDEQHGLGTINRTAIFPREIVRRALVHNAHGLVLVHNHPSGDPSPSDDDFRITRDIKRALTFMDMELHDHVIVGLRTIVSLRRIMHEEWHL